MATYKNDYPTWWIYGKPQFIELMYDIFIQRQKNSFLDFKGIVEFIYVFTKPQSTNFFETY